MPATPPPSPCLALPTHHLAQHCTVLLQGDGHHVVVGPGGHTRGQQAPKEHLLDKLCGEVGQLHHRRHLGADPLGGLGDQVLRGLRLPSQA